MAFELNPDKYDMHVTKTIRISYAEGAYDIGVLHLIENPIKQGRLKVPFIIQRMEYWDCKGNWIVDGVDRNVNMFPEEAIAYMKTCFEHRIQNKYDELTAKVNTSTAAFEEFEEKFK